MVVCMFYLANSSIFYASGHREANRESIFNHLPMCAHLEIIAATIGTRTLGVLDTYSWDGIFLLRMCVCIIALY